MPATALLIHALLIADNKVALCIAWLNKTDILQRVLRQAAMQQMSSRPTTCRRRWIYQRVSFVAYRLRVPNDK